MSDSNFEKSTTSAQTKNEAYVEEFLEHLRVGTTTFVLHPDDLRERVATIRTYQRSARHQGYLCL